LFQIAKGSDGAGHQEEPVPEYRHRRGSLHGIRQRPILKWPGLKKRSFSNECVKQNKSWLCTPLTDWWILFFRRQPLARYRTT